MADIIARLQLKSDSFDSKIKRATQGLLQMERECRSMGGTLAVMDKEQKAYVQSLGRMETVSQSARGRINELKQAYTELAVQYKRLTDEEKKGDYGRALSSSLEQLKGRIQSATKELNGVEGEMKGMGGVLSELGSKFGLSSDMMGVLTTGTIGMTAAITAGTTAVIAATKAWVDYNAELAKQDQITTVTTGLKGADADAMTDAARSISQVYDVDFREVINAANTLMTQFGQSGDNAIQLIRDGMQGMIQGDGPKLLSMIQQYAPSFRDAGVSASQLVAVIHNSEGGIFTDQNMNAIVMGIKNIRLMTNSTSEALGKLGIDGKKMSEQLNNGSMTIFGALKKVAGAVQNVDSSSQAAGEVMQQVFGRQGAMAGTKLGEAIATLNTNLEETKNQTGSVGESFAELEQANERLNAAMRETFGQKDFEEMATGIKTELVSSLTDVVKGLGEVTRFVGLADSAFSRWFSNAKTQAGLLESALLGILGPLGSIITMLKTIGGSGLSSEIKDLYANTGSGAGIGGSLGGIINGKTNNFTPVVPKGGKSGGGRAGRTARTGRTTTTKVEPPLPEGSIAALTKEMQELQKAQNLVTNTKDWQAYEEKIEDIKKKMSELRGDAKEVGNGGELENITVRAPKLFSSVRAYRQDNNTMSALGTFISDLKKSVQDTDIGSEIQQKTIERLKDATMVQDVLKQMIEDGVKGADLDGIATMLKDALVLGDIDEEEWQEFEDKINERLEKLNIDPISINVKTGEVGKKMKTDWQDAAKAVESVGSAMSQIEDPAAKVMGTVAQAIASIALGAAEAIKQPKPWPAWIAFAAAATATMVSTIATIHSATGYAQGGIVDGTQGGFVGGTAYSGDNVGNVRLNSGELVLNHAQQSALAAELEGNPMQNLELSTRISGRFLEIAINNDSRSRSRGKLVTSTSRT